MRLPMKKQEYLDQLAALLLPVVWFCSCPTGVAGQEQEVVRPRFYYSGSWKNSTWNKGSHVSSATLYIPTTKQLFILEIYKHPMVVSEDCKIKSYLEDGSEKLEAISSHAQTECYYNGRVRGYPGSLVAVSTCQGIRGTIHVDNTYYRIEPDTEGSVRHLLFSNPKTTAFLQSSREVRRRRSVDSAIRWPWRHEADSWVIELYLVVDHKEYLKYQDDVVQRAQEVVNHVSAVYSGLGIYVVLVGMEVWNVTDKITIEKSSPLKTLVNFQKYREKNIIPKFPNDNAQLIMRETFDDGANSKASLDAMCTNVYSAGINVDSEDDVLSLASHMAFSLGNNLGMSRDYDGCFCPDPACVMSKNTSMYKPTRFSSCSREQLARAHEQEMDYCLHNLPSVGYGGAKCGNGFLEAGEQCDCGPEEFCNSTCCNATTCTLVPGASCATGSCCNLTTCQLEPADRLCRAAVGPCGLDEKCTGTSEWCPPDIHYYNGKPCESANVSSYCYEGDCHTHDDQCRFMWGPTGKMANQLCYQRYNPRGGQYGSCGYDWATNSFTHCEFSDVLCGTLQCTKQGGLAFWSELLSKAMSTSYAGRERHQCNSVLLDVGSNDHNPSFVRDGTTCGDQKVCMKHKCVSLGDLGFFPESDCWGHGVHTNIGTCVCDPGWTGDDCRQGDMDMKPPTDALPVSDVDCGDPGEVPHARRWGDEYTVGASVTYFCLTEQVNATLLCLPDSTWNGTKPACTAPPVQTLSDTTPPVHTPPDSGGGMGSGTVTSLSTILLAICHITQIILDIH